MKLSKCKRSKQCPLRIATYNVQTLQGKSESVLDLMANEHIDILCLQETRLSTDGLEAVRRAVRQRGWTILCSEPALDAAGRICGGVAFIARWHVDVVSLESTPCEGDADRILLIRAPRKTAALGHPRPLPPCQ